VLLQRDIDAAHERADQMAKEQRTLKEELAVAQQVGMAVVGGADGCCWGAVAERVHWVAKEQWALSNRR